MLQFNLPLQQVPPSADAAEYARAAGLETSVNQILRRAANLGARCRAPLGDADRRQPAAPGRTTLRSALAAYESSRSTSPLLEAQRQIRQARVNLLKTQGDAAWPETSARRRTLIFNSAADLENSPSHGSALGVALAGGGYLAGPARCPPPIIRPASRPARPTTQPAKPARKLLYYRNPMGLPDTSPVPKKDPMGMDYLPVLGRGRQREQRPSASTRRFKSSACAPKSPRHASFDQTIRASGRVEIDERRASRVASSRLRRTPARRFHRAGRRRGQALFGVLQPRARLRAAQTALAAQGVETLAKSGETAQGG